MKKQILITQKQGNFLIKNESDFDSLQSKGFGEKKENLFLLSLYETLYLLEKEKIILENNKTFNQLMSSQKVHLEKYLVFKDLTQKGFLLKTGLKYGAEFRAYEKGQQQHANFLVIVFNQKQKLFPKELFAQTRVAHSTHKKLLLALIDDDLTLSYLELDWKKI